MQLSSNYHLIKTKDGSYTLFNKTLEESFNSYFGAKSESLYYFFEANGLLKEKRRPVNILEIGLGQGTNLLQALKLKGEIHYHSIEIDPFLIDYTIDRLNLNFTQENNHYFYTSTNFNIHLYLADASQHIFKIISRFDFFFHDPFSPGKNPTLWSYPFFRQLKNLAKEGAILTSYSSASLARKNMNLAGWQVKKIKGFASKREALLATT